MTTALILVGHGSHISAETAGIVWRQVDALRALGVADEVTAAFWKEMPSFHNVFRSLCADDVTVIPLFTAQGYFTQTAIPAEMGILTPHPQPPLRKQRGGFKKQRVLTIRYARTLSEHPALDEIVKRRVADAYAALGSVPAQTAIAVIGHSTRRNAESRKATEAQAARLRAAGLAAQVEAVYLDDTPSIPDIYKLTSAPTLIAVPFFLAAGSHTTQDVPESLGLPEGLNHAVINGRTVYYTPPVGDDDTLPTMLLDLAREAGAPLYQAQPRGAWDGFPTAGRDALRAAVHAAGELRFGELRLTSTTVQVWDDCGEKEDISTPAALRARLREAPFRPLPTALGLPCGWRVDITHDAMLHAVVDTVYPVAVADWAAAQAGTLPVAPLAAVLARQTGIFRAISPMDAAEQAAWVARVCGGCACQPLWADNALPADAIPCAEACNLWLSRVLEER